MDIIYTSRKTTSRVFIECWYHNSSNFLKIVYVFAYLITTVVSMHTWCTHFCLIQCEAAVVSVLGIGLVIERSQIQCLAGAVVVSLNKKLLLTFLQCNGNLASARESKWHMTWVGCKFSLTESVVDCSYLAPVEHLSKPVSPQRTFTVHSAG